MDVKQGLLYGVREPLSPCSGRSYAIRVLEVDARVVVGVEGGGRVLEVERSKLDSWIPDTELFKIFTRRDLDTGRTDWVVYRNVPTWDGEARISRNGRRAVVLSSYGHTHEGKRWFEADVFYEVSVEYVLSLIVEARTHDHEVEPALSRHSKVSKALRAAGVSS